MDPVKVQNLYVPYHQAIRIALQYRDYSDAAAAQFRIGAPGDERFADDSEYRAWIMRHLIESADVGICDVDTRREPIEFPDFIREQLAKEFNDQKLPENRVVVSFVHHGKSSQAIEFTKESAGTKKLFNLSNAGGDWETST